MAGPDELALIPFPTDELFNEHLGSFDLVIFQNFEYGPYQMARYLPRIRDYVLRGGSFAMIGGPLSFHSGGYAGDAHRARSSRSTCRRRARRRARDAGRRTASSPASPAGHGAPPAARAGRRTPCQNAEAWSRLAPLDGRQRGLAGAAGGHGAARAPAGTAPRAASRCPVLVLGTAGSRPHPRAHDRHDLALGHHHRRRDRRRLGLRALLGPGGALARPRSLARAGADHHGSRALRAGARAPRSRRTLRDDRYAAPTPSAPVTFVLLDGAGPGCAPTPAPRTDREGGLAAEPRAAGRSRARTGWRRDSPGRTTRGREEWLVVEAGGDELADPRAAPGRAAGARRGDRRRLLRVARGRAAARRARHHAHPLARASRSRAPFASLWAFAARWSGSSSPSGSCAAAGAVAEARPLLDRSFPPD